MYHNELRFLDKHLTKKDRKKIDMADDDAEDNHSDESSNSSNESFNIESDSDLDGTLDSVEFVPEKTIPRKRKRVDTDTKYNSPNKLNEIPQETSDGDVAFFNSLLPTVRELNTRDKLLFRSEVMQELINHQIDKNKSASGTYNNLHSNF